jgi:K+-sensing histidine kinase KdpD
MPPKHYFNWQVIVAVLWLVLSIALTTWWMIFAFNIIEQSGVAAHRQKQMLVYEGITLFLLLISGGFFLVYFILREKKRNLEMQNFFSAFTHDIKTMLAGVRIQSESLKQDLVGTTHIPLIERLLTDTSRLHVKLENTLLVGRDQLLNLFIEKGQLTYFFEVLKDSWPQLHFEFQNDAMVLVDKRIFEMVLQNIVHNSYAHGQAKNIKFVTSDSKQSPGFVNIKMADDGVGFKGDYTKLGKKYFRQNPSSGTGLGLYTCVTYLTKMQGKIEFSNLDEGKGFLVNIEIPGELNLQGKT